MSVRRPGPRGITLLEIMITIVLLTTVLITFAAVYPSGYKLNRKTARATQAAKAASAIAEEIQAVPFFHPTGNPPTLNSLQATPYSQANLATWNGWGLYPERHVQALGQPFFLEDGTSIVVQLFDDGTGTTAFANISVTVSYREVGASTFDSSDTETIQRVTITTAKTLNRPVSR